MNEFGELRSLLQSPYSPELWDEVRTWLEHRDHALLERELIPYASSILARWPLDSRPMPPQWRARLLAHNDPGRFPTEHPGAAGHYIRAAGSLSLSSRERSRPNDLRRLSRSPFIGAIEGLTLTDLTMLPEDVDALCEEPSLDDLHALTLERTSPHPKRLPEVLARRAWRLRHLTVDGVRLSSDFFDVLAGHPSNQTLTRLDLERTLLDDDALLTLADTLPPHLTHLTLTCARASRDAFAALLEALSSLPDLTHLDLFGAELYPRDLDVLPESVVVPRGRHPEGVILATYDLGPRFGGLKAITFDQDQVVIGRSRQDDLIIPHANVTHEHVTLSRQNNRLTMTDGGSPNGFLVNRVRVDGSAVLSPEDTAYVGPAYIKVDIVSDTY